MTMQGRRIALRDIRLDDLAAYATWHKPGQRWQDSDGPDLGAPSTPEEDAAWLEKRLAQLRERIETGAFSDPRTRLVIAERDGDRMIGEVSRYVEHKVLDWQAVGISIFDDSLWGRGRGYEALGLWVDYQFRSHPDWHRLMMGTWSGNVGMVRLAAKLGFVEEARYRRARHIRGEWYDSLGFGILREEWQARYPDGFAASLGAG